MGNKFASLTLVGALMVAGASQVHAGSIEKLQAFVAQTQSARANFRQDVIDEKG